MAQEEASRQSRDIEQQDMCMAEVELLHLKISQYEALGGIDNCLSVGSINGYKEKMEGFLEEYFNLAKKLKYYLGERYDKPHGTIFELKSKNMSEDLKMAKILKQELAKFFGEKEANLTAITKSKNQHFWVQQI